MQRMLIKVAVIVIAAAAFILCSLYCIPDRDLIRAESSPDGSREVRLYRSLTDFTHAPYGYELELRRPGRFLWDETYIFYAGYCDEVPAFRWNSPESAHVSCQSGSDIRTRAGKAWGINISYALGGDNHGPGEDKVSE